MKVLATGATGKYGKYAVPALLQRGIEVRAAVHDPSKADDVHALGVDDVVDLDYDDADSVASAVRGVDGVFILTPAFHPHATQMGLTMVSAAAESGVGKVVYNGVYHPSLRLINHTATQPVEEALYWSDIDFTVLQPAMYVQALADTYREALRSGEVVAPWSKSSKMSYVDYRDVAEAAAIAFTDPRLARGTFELAAGGMITRIEIAELMSQAAGRPLRAQDIPKDAAADEDQPEGLGLMFADYDAHGFHGGNPLVLETILQRKPRSVAAFILELAGT